MAVAPALADAFVIEGGKPLSGTIRAAGNKNGALPILAATLLASEPVTLRNVPRIRDVDTMLELLAELGADATWAGPNEVHVNTAAVASPTPDPALGSKIRASFLLAGPLLARFGRATMPPPGGDVIGPRRLDRHERPRLRDDDGRSSRRARVPRRGERDGDGERDHGGGPLVRRDGHRQRR